MSGFSSSNQFGYSPLHQSQVPYPNNPGHPQAYPDNSAPNTAGYSSYPYPGNSAPTTAGNSTYPYPNQQPDMSGTGYPGGGYPTSTPSYPNTGGYPNSGGYPNPGGYPNSGNVPGSTGPPPPGVNPEICPSAPDLSQMEKIPGYERLTFEDEIVMPPALPEWKPDEQERKQVENLPSLSEDDVRGAALQFVSEHCCYGSGAARNMAITHINMMSAFHYKLETFGEKRESAWRFLPYNGQPIDGPMNGPAPRPWDILATPSALFVNSKMKMEVPHTAFVKPCHTCVGNGRVRCNDCNGFGKSQCTWCNGRGSRTRFDNNEMCTSCNGTGSSRCTWCSGTGQKTCKTCNGKAQLKGFVELTITWTNHVDDYISETSSMPKELVRQVTGQIAFEEEYPRVYPIMHTTDEIVRRASNDFINKHSTAFPNERILKQRHCLRLIPIGEVSYQWKSKSDVYYVYGYEHKVYFGSYPQKCCCCTIL